MDYQYRSADNVYTRAGVAGVIVLCGLTYGHVGKTLSGIAGVYSAFLAHDAHVEGNRLLRKGDVEYLKKGKPLQIISYIWGFASAGLLCMAAIPPSGLLDGSRFKT